MDEIFVDIQIYQKMELKSTLTNFVWQLRHVQRFKKKLKLSKKTI